MLGENIIKEASNSAIKWSHLYDATTANYLRKDTTDTIKVTVYEIFSNGNTNASQPAIGTRLVENTTDAAIGVILKDSVRYPMQNLLLLSSMLQKTNTQNQLILDLMRYPF